jgi:hypothetical protein
MKQLRFDYGLAESDCQSAQRSCYQGRSQVANFSTREKTSKARTPYLAKT